MTAASKAVPTIDMPDRRFQAHFEPRQRGQIANLFLDPVRRGMTEPLDFGNIELHDMVK